MKEHFMDLHKMNPSTFKRENQMSGIPQTKTDLNALLEKVADRDMRELHELHEKASDCVIKKFEKALNKGPEFPTFIREDIQRQCRQITSSKKRVSVLDDEVVQLINQKLPPFISVHAELQSTPFGEQYFELMFEREQ